MHTHTRSSPAFPHTVKLAPLQIAAAMSFRNVLPLTTTDVFTTLGCATPLYNCQPAASLVACCLLSAGMALGPLASLTQQLPAALQVCQAHHI